MSLCIWAPGCSKSNHTETLKLTDDTRRGERTREDEITSWRPIFRALSCVCLLHLLRCRHVGSQRSPGARQVIKPLTSRGNLGDISISPPRSWSNSAAVNKIMRSCFVSTSLLRHIPNRRVGQSWERGACLLCPLLTG